MRRKDSRAARQLARPCQEALKAFLMSRRVNGLFYHCQLANQMRRVGFEVSRVEKMNHHGEVWRLVLRRGHVRKGHECDWAKSVLRLFLKGYGIKYPKREICTMVEGNRIKIAFNWV